MIGIRNPHFYNRYTSEEIILQNLLIKIIDVRQKAISQFLCKLFSYYEEAAEEISDVTDVDSRFHYNIFDLSLSQQRQARVSKGSNEKTRAIKLFLFCCLKAQQHFISREDVNIFTRELSS